MKIVEKAPWERGNPAVYGLAGLAIGVLLSSLMGMGTKAGWMGVIYTLFKVYTTPAHLVSTVLYSGPIVASAVGLSLAYRGRFITIGSEGQVILGSIASIGVLVYSGLRLDHWIMMLLAVLTASLVGIAWGLIPGILRAYLGVNEILSSLMLNYVALYMVNYLVSGPWSNGPFTMTKPIDEAYMLPPEAVFLILLALALSLELVLRRTRLGIGIDAYGLAPRAATTYGFNPKKIVLTLSAISGLTAGMGGALMLMGFQVTLKSMSQPPGYGYMGVLVAWLAFRSPLGSLLGGIFFSSLLTAGYQLQVAGVPLNAVLAMQAVIVLSVLVASTFAKYRVTLG